MTFKVTKEKNTTIQNLMVELEAHKNSTDTINLVHAKFSALLTKL